MTVVRVSWANGSVGLNASNAAIERLTKLLAPSFNFLAVAETTQRDTDCTIEVTNDSLSAPAGHDGLPIQLHAEGVGTFRSADPGLIFVHNATVGATYRARQRHLEVCYSGETADVVDLMQIIRSLLLEIELAKGSSLLHGSVISLNDSGVMFTGSKGAGKTASLLGLCGRPNVSYVTNDKVLLHGRTGYGVPQAIAASPWLVQSFGALYQHTSDRVANGKQLFFPIDLQRSIPVRRSVELKAIIDVRAQQKDHQVTWQPLDQEQGEAVVREARIFSNRIHGDWVQKLGVVIAGQPELDQRVGGIPVFRSSFNPWSNESCDSLLDLLDGHKS